MSVIGTTHKQPRVFAHDATALEDLCGATGVITALVAAPPSEVGSGYTAGDTYPVSTPGGGINATVEVLTVTDPVVGDVATFSLTTGGEHYEVGDVLTLVGGDNNCRIVVATVSACTTWANGDPLVPTSSTFNSVNYTFEKENYYWNDGSGVHSGRACAALYIGADMATLEVIQEGKAIQGAPTAPTAADTPSTTYHNVPAGSFLPISVVTVLSATATTPGDLPAGGVNEVILALF